MSIFSLRTTILFITLILSVFSLLTYQAHAQFALPQQGGAGIIAKPEYPTAREQVTLSMGDYSLNNATADLYWYANGTEIPGSKNKREIKINAPNFGEKIVVELAVVQSGLTISRTSYTIAPIQIDIIIESQTYTPSFYQGRALPSRDSNVRAIAVVHDGSGANAGSYSYKWTLNEDVLFGGPLKGGNFTDFAIPTFGGRIEVQVFNAAGAVVGEKTIAIPSVSPMILFYEFSPLRGLIQRSIQDGFSTASQETTVYGEPFFINTSSAKLQSNQIEWSLNNERVSGQESQPNTIRLMRSSGAAQANLQMSITTAERRPQQIRELVTLSFIE